MNIRDISCFIKVCENKSISATAESFFMSPQGISKAIKRMETELHAELLTRTKNGVSLTEYGQVFYTHCVTILKEYRQTTKAIENLKAQNIGLIRMVSAFGILRFLSPEFIHAFTNKYPTIHLEYTEFPDSYIEKSILNEEYNVGLVPYLNENPDLEYIPLFSKEIYFITHKQSKFYTYDQVSVREISSEPFIMENENFLIHHIIKDIAAIEATDLDVYFNTSGFSLCYKLCTEGEGNTVSMDFIFDDMNDGTLKSIPFKEHPKWKIALVHKKDTPLSKNMKAFIDYTREWCQSL